MTGRTHRIRFCTKRLKRVECFMQNREHAKLLLRKAKEDEFTVEKLVPDPASPDEVIGFHAQQAVEKMLKGVLTWRAVRYPFAHDLAALLDLLRENKILFPEELE